MQSKTTFIDTPHLERIRHELEVVPQLPGIYIWKGSGGEVLYVGKAKQLKNRMKQYLNRADERLKIPLMLERLRSFDYIVVENEQESLILEKQYIQKYKPYFNTDFKDDKSYPYLAITKSCAIPALKYTREAHRKGTLYFGPYTDSKAARKMFDLARKVVPLCSAQCANYKKLVSRLKPDDYARIQELLCHENPCFDASVGRGPGICCGQVSLEEYEHNVRRLVRFLSGEHEEFVRELQADMHNASLDLDFERAARIKERIDVIEALSYKQRIDLARQLDADVIGIYREETIAAVHLFIIREGKIINSNEFVLNHGLDVFDDDLLRNFLFKYYTSPYSVPRELILDCLPEDAPALETWLTKLKNHPRQARVHLVAPKRGERLELLQMAQNNARHVLARYKMRSGYDDERINRALIQLESALALERPPYRIECYDISTIHGSYTVASMVVFVNGKPDKSQYRRFRIKTPLDEANDFLSMREVMARRFESKRREDTRFGQDPDLVILDGGLPQLSVVQDQFSQMNIDSIALCGLAKRDEELFVPWMQGDPLVLPSGSESLYLIKHIRDEAHRVAIEYHRLLRSKGMTASILDEVEGLGPKRKKLVLKHFGSFKKLKEASVEEIAGIKGIPQNLAEEIYTVLRQYAQTPLQEDGRVLAEKP